MSDNSSALPHGFFDYVGEKAELRKKVYNDFINTGKQFGMKATHLCPIGYESTFTSMGTINRETVYPFKDTGGRDLMLSADSLSSMTRMFRNLMNSAGTLKGRYVGKSEIFRNRRKKYKNWTHLIGTYFNESNELAGDISIILFAKSFMEKYYDDMKFIINDYGILNEVFKECGISSEDGYQLLYRLYTKKEENDFQEYGKASIIIKDIEDISNSQDSYLDKFDEIAKKYSFLQTRINVLKRYCDVLEKNGINFNFSFENYKAIEYHSGLYFYVKDDVRNVNIADGGGYHRSVNEVDNRIKMCHSFACSLEDIVEHIVRQGKDFSTIESNDLYALKMDSSDEFFYEVCAYLRNLGYNVNDIWAEGNIRKIISKLPKDCKKVFVGQQEEQEKSVLIKSENQTDKIEINNLPYKSKISYTYEESECKYKIYPIIWDYDCDTNEIKHHTKVVLPNGKVKSYQPMINPYKAYNYMQLNVTDFVPIIHPKYDTMEYLKKLHSIAHCNSLRILPYESGIQPQFFSKELINYLTDEGISITLDEIQPENKINRSEWEDFFSVNNINWNIKQKNIKENDER